MNLCPATEADRDAGVLHICDSVGARREGQRGAPTGGGRRSSAATSGWCGREGDRRLAARRPMKPDHQHIAEMECDIGICQHGPDKPHTRPTPPPPEPRAQPATVMR